MAVAGLGTVFEAARFEPLPDFASLRTTQLAGGGGRCSRRWITRQDLASCLDSLHLQRHPPGLSTTMMPPPGFAAPQAVADAPAAVGTSTPIAPSPASCRASAARPMELKEDGNKTLTPPEGFEDCLPLKNLIQKSVVTGRQASVDELENKKPMWRPIKLGQHAIDPVPRRFYVQVDVNDLSALVIPTDFKPVLEKKLMIKYHPACMSLKTTSLLM